MNDRALHVNGAAWVQPNHCSGGGHTLHTSVTTLYGTLTKTQTAICLSCEADSRRGSDASHSILFENNTKCTTHAVAAG